MGKIPRALLSSTCVDRAEPSAPGQESARYWRDSIEGKTTEFGNSVIINVYGVYCSALLNSGFQCQDPPFAQLPPCSIFM